MNIFQQFAKSLYSPETIAKFRFQKIGKTIGYVFFLMLIVTIPPSIIFGMTLNSFFDSAENFVEDLPEFEIQNGVLSTPDNETYIDDTGELVFIVDAAGNVDRSELAQYTNVVALYETEVVANFGGTSEQVRYQEFGANLTSDEIQGFASSIIGLSPLFIGVFIIGIYLFTTALKFIGVSFLALIGLLLKKNVADQLAYRQLWRLAAYAVTLPTVVFAIIDLIVPQLPFSFGLYWIVAIVMMNLALKAVPKPKQPSVDPIETGNPS
ncbi:DUF1189 domain-containing protein [Paenalkalicoccus suaedae]|uniref:DUF1189 domain-containing protein n=1 Tax=Paenalkalicoccus suaedae TaxID=2592382 RepID=A0A859FFB0_9BACI|nr:DUF1189 domain-containing protein [Paenalkalicoccus suaedae]QKS70905.1 DUF1189 domain-containing protein [Paenalkalicoccus suaedae]